jgi:hypothetical protein
MRVAVLTGGRGVLLAGPMVLAFFAGGYFPEAQAWAGLVVWILVAAAAVAVPDVFRSRTSTRLALIALSLLAAGTTVSVMWAPIAGSAYHAGQRVIMYAGALIAAYALLRDRAVLRAVEPALAAGALIVIGYGISERLFPGFLHFQRSVSAEGRLDQPLTYWNAMGELAAIGFVLCVRLAGDETRRRSLRTVAAAASAPLGMGLYLTFSRGALFAWAAGLVALVVLAPRRDQLRAIAITVCAGALAALAAAPSHAVTALHGAAATREQEGAVAAALLAAIVLAAALAMWRAVGTVRASDLRLPRRAPSIALVLICAGLAAAIVVGAKERSPRPLSAGATRLATLQSNRYAYWRVAVRAFLDQPIRGVGAEGWAVYWLRDRRISEFAQDAHSWPLQTLAELGIIGFGLLVTFVGAIAWAAGSALRADRVLAAGPVAGLVVYLVHAPLDWDWQMPAVTLVALALSGAVLAITELTAPPRSAAPPG